jgi:hypothetical protein
LDADKISGNSQRVSGLLALLDTVDRMLNIVTPRCFKRRAFRLRFIEAGTRLFSAYDTPIPV